MSCTVRISSKNQIVIPKEARERMGLRPGQELLVLCKEDRVVLIPKPRDFVAETRGLYKETWQGIGAEAYLEKERQDWEEEAETGPDR